MATERVALSRQRVLTVAVEMADALGIEALTMRKLGVELGVEAMSLYHHVANKSDLLDGMVDVVYAEIEVPADLGWRAAMRARCASVRAALTRHPWATTLLESRTTPGPATLRQHDAVLGVLRRSGFPVALAAHAFSLLDAYVFGFCVQEVSMPFSSGDEAADVAAVMLADAVGEAYPFLRELAVEHVAQPGYDYGDEFDYGLELVLDGLERALRDG